MYTVVYCCQLALTEKRVAMEQEEMIEGEESKQIRVKEGTKQCLDQLKLVNQEPYDNVIQRIIKNYVEHDQEDKLPLNDETREIIKERLNAVQRGEVISTKELMDRVRKRKHELRGSIE